MPDLVSVVKIMCFTKQPLDGGSCNGAKEPVLILLGHDELIFGR